MNPGLDRANALKPGQGWVAAKIQAATDVPLNASIEAGVKLSTDVALFGDVWVKPSQETFGADVGLRLHDNLDLFAGGWADLHGGAGVQAGLEWRF